LFICHFGEVLYTSSYTEEALLTVVVKAPSVVVVGAAVVVVGTAVVVVVTVVVVDVTVVDVDVVEVVVVVEVASQDTAAFSQTYIMVLSHLTLSQLPAFPALNLIQSLSTVPIGLLGCH